MNIPGLAAVVCALVLFGAPLRAQTVSDVVTARETLKGLEAAAARADSDRKARIDAAVLLGKLGPQITTLETPGGETDTARLIDLRKLSKSVADTLARERNGQPAEDLRREAKELSAAFTKLYPERTAPAAQAGSRSGGAEQDPATAEQAAARGAAGGQAAISQPRQFYDGGKTTAGPEAAVAPAGGISSNGTRRRLKLSPPTAPVGLREAPVPPAPAESAETKACREAMRDHPEDADGCVTSPSLTPLKAGLFDSIKEQFGTVKGLAMNLGFMLMGLAMSVLSGFGLIAKTVVTIASVGLLLWTLPPLLKQGWDAAWKFGQTNAGDPEHSRALLTLGKLGGTVLIMALMSVIGWGVGKTLTQGATTKIAALLEARGVKSPLTAIDAAAPPALTAFLTPKVKPVAAGGVEPIARSAKSAAQVSEATLRRNAGITDREVRIGETMKQLDVDRGFAEKVADAHDQVPCPVGTCTPAQLRAKVEIMGRGPKADAAIRAGLAGEPPAPVPPTEGPAPVAAKAPALEGAPQAAPFLDTTARFTPSTAQRAPAPSRFSLEEYMRATSRGATPLERPVVPVEPRGLVPDQWMAQEGGGTRFQKHVANPELTEVNPKAYRPRKFKGGGHMDEGIIKGHQDIAASVEQGRARYNADLARQAELIRQSGQRALRPKEAFELESLTSRLAREEKPPAPGEHWSAQPLSRLKDLSNGVQRVLLPKEAFKDAAWKMMERQAEGNTDPAKGYVAGGKTLFPKEWTEPQIAEAIQSVKKNPAKVFDEGEGRTTLVGEATVNGQTVRIEVGLDRAGKITTGFPTWNQ